MSRPQRVSMRVYARRQRLLHAAPALLLLFAVACSPIYVPVQDPDQAAAQAQGDARPGVSGPESTALAATPSAPYPQRPRYQPGELVDYTAQTGDTLVGLAKRFNTSVPEILAANSFIPATATTMPPGMPMRIPIYYLPLWGSPERLMPDSLFINGPAQLEFDTEAFVAQQPGWLNQYRGYVSDSNRTGAQIVDLVARNYSLSPRLLLALLEHQSGALSQPEPPAGLEDYPLGYKVRNRQGLFAQLGWAANQLNAGYYGFRTLDLQSIEHRDGRIERIDPWQNAASVALMRFFNTLESSDEAYFRAIGPGGFMATYSSYFGDAWQNDAPHLPGSLEQPFFLLPFTPGDVWALTGGPHASWGSGPPLGALDFAPPSKSQGCVSSDRWAVAVADGVVVRSEWGQVMLDLDGDGDERTGWNVFYLHIATLDRAPLGAVVKAGDPLGHPSCEGGSATGTHIHMARKYNGEWMPAQGIGENILAFNMEGWVALNGSLPYEGFLKRNALMVWANTNANSRSFIQTDRR